MFTISLAGKHTFKKDVRKLTILCLKRRGNSSFYSIEVYFTIKWKSVPTAKFNELILAFPIELLLRSVSDASL